jgi:gliding motility-associated protein GldM
MKRSVLLISSLLILPIVVIAQEIGKDAVVAASNMNVLYVGIPNPVEIAIPGVTSDKVTATFSNGTIKKVSNGWTVVPDKTGKSTITILVDNKKVSEKEFRVKSVPDPVAVFAGRNSGAIPKEVALKTEVIEAEIPDFAWDLKFEIVSFVFLVSKDNMDYERRSDGNKLTDKMKTLMSDLVSGHSFYFKDIKAIGPDGKTTDLKPIVFKID